MKRSALPGMALLALVSLTTLTGADSGGCGLGLNNKPGVPGVDVGGVTGATWDLSYSDALQVTVKSSGGFLATQTLSVIAGGTFKVDSAVVDLRTLCARGDVACPQDVFPSVVTMTQPGQDLHFLDVTFNPKGPFGGLRQTTLVGNVDSMDDFAIALGIGGAAVGPCGLLGVSIANGHIGTTFSTPPVGTSLSGEIITSYSGGCLAIGAVGAVGAGFTVEMHLPFSARRR